MRRILAGTLALGLGATTFLARAQADEPPVAAAPAVDAPELEARYQAALDDFAARRFAAAAEGFDAVAAASVDPTRRTVAAEMARQARARAAVERPALPSTTPAAPGTTPGAPLVPPAPAGDATLTPQSRDGRYVLLVGTSLVGLSLYGPTLASRSDSGGKTAVGLYMLGAGASFFVPYVATRVEPVTWGMSDAWWYGGTHGALHGFLALELRDTNPSGDDGLVAASLGSLIEGGTFTLWAALTDASPGMTNIMGKGADFGAALSLGVASIVLPDDSWGERAASASALVGAGAGFVLGRLYGGARDLTWGDGEVMRTTGALGAYAAAVPLVLGEVEDRRAVAGTLVAGGLAGLYLGDRLLDGRDFSAGQGIVVELSTSAGALVGAGLGYLVSPDDDDTAAGKIIATGAILGAAGGFVASYLGLETRARRADAAGSAVTVHIAPQVTGEQKGLVVAGTF